MDRERLESALTSLGVPHRRVTHNAVNVCCPLCPTPDTDYHCGVFLSNLRFSCWRCRGTGSLRRLLDALGLDGRAVERALGGLPMEDRDKSLADRVRGALGGPAVEAAAPAAPVEMPSSDPVDRAVLAEAPALAVFLADRGISPETCERYDARWTGNVGRYAHRLVLPVWGEDGQLAAWQARDVTGRARTKYLTGGRVSETLYWTDLEERGGGIRLYVVEGVLDAWRMGGNAAATFTHALSRAQRRLLLADDRMREVVVAWDGDSWGLSRAAARGLAPLVRAGAVRLPEGEDPDRLGRRRIMELEVEWA